MRLPRRMSTLYLTKCLVSNWLTLLVVSDVQYNARIWLMAARPKTLWAGVSPVMIGVAMAIEAGKFHLASASLCLLGAVSIQVGTNFANDYYDFVKGADTDHRKGPTRATQAGLIRPENMKRAFVAAMMIVALLGFILFFRAGWPVLLIAALSIISGILYTGGPYPYGYRGLGEVFVFIFFGLVAVGGTYFVQALTINTNVIIAGVAPGLLSAAILAVNNLRDVDEDRSTGKRTLAVVFGATFAKCEYTFFILVASTIPIILFYRTHNHTFSLLSCLVLVLAVPSIKKVSIGSEGTVLNQVLATTGKHLFFYSAIFSIGWVI